jgi:hypothetical protein
MKYKNVPSYRIAMAYGCHLVGKFEDDTNEITKAYAISSVEWKELKKCGGL